MKRMPIISPLFPDITELQDEIGLILASGQVSNGKYVQRLESDVADYLGVKHFVTFCNGETALIAMLAVAQLSGEVIIPAYTFVGTPHALLWNRLTPVLADVDPQTWTIDPKEIEARIGVKTSAILAVPILGNPAHNDVLAEIAERHQLALLFDSAQGFGSTYRGKHIGNFGLTESFSFHATKVFSTMEGGGVATHDEGMRNRLVAIRNFGKVGQDCQMLGLNGKMTEIAALVGLKNLQILDSHIRHRQELVARYQEQLRGIPGIQFQGVTPGALVAPHLFQILTPRRDEIIGVLGQHNIEARSFMSPPLYDLSFYLQHEQYPIAEQIAYTSVALPLHSNMRIEEVDRVCSIIKELYEIMPSTSNLQ